MQNSKLILLLKSLKAEEIRWFSKFVCSPFYNSNSHVIALFEVLKKHHPDFDSKHLTKEKLWRKLFPNQKMVAGRMRLLMHNLAELIEAFIVANQLRNQSSKYKKLLNIELGRRDLYELFEKNTFKLIEELEETPYRDTEYYKEKKELLLIWYGHPGTNRQKRNNIIEQLWKEMKISNSLEELQLIFAHNERITINPNTAIQEIPQRTLDIAKESNNWLLNIFIALNQLRNDKNNSILWEKIMLNFIENIHQIRILDKRLIIQILINNGSRLYNSGQSKNGEALFKLYQIGLENDCILINNEMTETTFQNIISLGSLCKKNDWVKTFIETCQHNLPLANQPAAIGLGLGTHYFYHEKFDDAIDILIETKFTNPLQEITARITLLKCYFEKFNIDSSYFDLLLSQIRAFEKFIRRKQILTANKVEMLSNFGKILKKIAEQTINGKGSVALRQQILDTELLLHRGWLLAKVAA